MRSSNTTVVVMGSLKVVRGSLDIGTFKYLAQQLVPMTDDV